MPFYPFEEFEQRVDSMSAGEAEQARVNMKPS